MRLRAVGAHLGRAQEAVSCRVLSDRDEKRRARLIIRQSRYLTSSEKTVWSRISSFQRVCFAGLPYLAQTCGISKYTIPRARQRLVRFGLIWIKRNTGRYVECMITWPNLPWLSLHRNRSPEELAEDSARLDAVLAELEDGSRSVIWGPWFETERIDECGQAALERERKVQTAAAQDCGKPKEVCESSNQHCMECKQVCEISNSELLSSLSNQQPGNGMLRGDVAGDGQFRRSVQTNNRDETCKTPDASASGAFLGIPGGEGLSADEPDEFTGWIAFSKALELPDGQQDGWYLGQRYEYVRRRRAGHSHRALMAATPGGLLVRVPEIPMENPKGGSAA